MHSGDSGQVITASSGAQALKAVKNHPGVMGDGGTLAEGVLLLEKPFTERVLLARVEQALHVAVLIAS
jgi:hypothetical protein